MLPRLRGVSATQLPDIWAWLRELHVRHGAGTAPRLCWLAQGYRAGYVAGAFMIGRLVSSTAWGVWSDSHGRKPVLYAGCVTIAVTSIAFGLSFSYWWMLLTRFLGGIGNGITSTAKTCTSEVAHESHQAKGAGLGLRTRTLPVTLRHT